MALSIACGQTSSMALLENGEVIHLMIFFYCQVYEQVGAQGSVVICIRPVTKRSMVQTPLWSFLVMCCARRQGTVSTLSQSTQLTQWTGVPSRGSQSLSLA